MSFAETLKEALRIMAEKKRGTYRDSWYRESSHSRPNPNYYHQFNRQFDRYDPYPDRRRTPWDFRGDYHHRDMGRREHTYNPPEEPYIPPTPPASGEGTRRKKKASAGKGHTRR